MALNVGTLIAQLKLDTSEFTKGIKTATSESNSLSSSITNNAASIKKAGAVATVAGGAIVGAFGLATKASVDFESGMAEVFTLLPGLTADAYGQMTEDLREFNTELGVTSEESIPALYQAISAGVPADNVFEFLETAQKAAVGGVTDLETAVDGISSVVNAYGSDVLSATEASDLMFTAVKLGKTNFEELSSSLYNVVPVASSLGLEFGNVTAAISTMTAQGVPTKQATTQIRQLLVELSKQGSKTSDTFIQLSGKSFKDFIAEGNNLQDALELLAGGLTSVGIKADENAENIGKWRGDLAKYKDQLVIAKMKQDEFTDSTKESTKVQNQQKIDSLTAKIAQLERSLANTSDETIITEMAMNDLFGSVEAGNAVLALTGKGAEKFSSDLEAMNESTGALETAYGTMDESTGRSIDKIMALFEEFKLQIGDVFLPILKDQILPVLSNLLKTFGDLPDWVKPVILVIGGLGAALVVIGPLLIALPGMIGAISAAFTILSANPIILAVGGLILLLIWLQKEFDILGIAVDVIGKIFKGWANIAKIVVDSVVSAFKWLWEQIKPIIDFAILAFQTFGKVIGTVADFIFGVFNTIVGTIKSAINWVIDGVNTIIRGLNRLHVDIPDWLGGGTIGFNLDTIPKLAEGGIVTEPTLAMIGEGRYDEAVIPLDGKSGFGGDNISINVDKMEVRNDNDIKRVAQELYSLINTKNRGRGINYGY